MPNLTEEQIKLYQAFGCLMPGDQFVTSSGTVAVVEAIQGMIDASLLKDKAQSVNNAEPLLKDKTNDLVKLLRKVDEENMYAAPFTTKTLINAAADRIEELEALLEQRDAFIVSKNLWFEFVDSLTLAGEKKDDQE